MRAIYKNLLDKSVAAALSSIEIYNKPDFKYREEIFVILLINAWELLLKAKILKNEKKPTSLYVYAGRRIKRNRAGTPFTIDIVGALRELDLNDILEENLDRLIEVRDTAIHFYNTDSTSYLVYSLGAASLRNFNKLIKQWFGINLSKTYNFNILPLGFAYNFKTFTTLDIDNEPGVVRNIILDISKRQKENRVEKDGFYLVCEIRAELVSAKKIVDSEALRIVVDKEAKNAPVAIIERKNITDLYPHTWTDIRDKLRKEIPNFNQNQLHNIIKKNKIKGNKNYSAYNFRNQRQERGYKRTGEISSGIPVLYNNDCYKLIRSQVNKKKLVRLNTQNQT